MRTTFARTLERLASEDRDLFLLTSDLGFRLFDGFRESHPGRFINVGVAETNMIGVAAGMALEGKNVYCYSMVPFLILRALEQIRIDICYHNVGVKLVGVGAGVTYGLEGITHHGLEDLCALGALPNLAIVAPGDPREAEALVKASAGFPGPLYLRLGGNNDPPVHRGPLDLGIGRGVVLRRGEDVTLCATGGMLYTASRAAEGLSRLGVEVTLVSMPTIKPLDIELVRECAQESKAFFTVEDHRQTGGLGSAVAERLLEMGWRGRFRKFAFPDTCFDAIGGKHFLQDRFGLSAEAISRSIIDELRTLA